MCKTVFIDFGVIIRLLADGRTTYSTAVFSTTPTTMIITTSTDKYSVDVRAVAVDVEFGDEYEAAIHVIDDARKIRFFSGPATMEEACGLNPCPTPTNTFTCTGRLVLPCDLMDRLTFGERPSSTAIFNDPCMFLAFSLPLLMHFDEVNPHISCFLVQPQSSPSTLTGKIRSELFEIREVAVTATISMKEYVKKSNRCLQSVIGD
ncbi:unnamed protein product [Toxocara canis]|uniref:Uncharacterized protein n=1 Tax=Toxocara canis TaxID=6265 RepID=A0A183UUM7_TOXCA|nr:unnamed protein product [Toxocara canis]